MWCIMRKEAIEDQDSSEDENEGDRDGDADIAEKSSALLSRRGRRPVRKTYEASMAKVNRCEVLVADLEFEMRVSVRWTPASSHYQEARKYSQECTYIRALDHLERLVVQRLFELQKANMESTGECYMLLRLSQPIITCFNRI